MRSYLSKLNNKSHQYPYFRSVIPKDILLHFDGITEFRLSLSSVKKKRGKLFVSNSNKLQINSLMKLGIK